MVGRLKIMKGANFSPYVNLPDIHSQNLRRAWHSFNRLCFHDYLDIAFLPSIRGAMGDVLEADRVG